MSFVQRAHGGNQPNAFALSLALGASEVHVVGSVENLQAELV
jgi:hypothetical protein